ncbi:hypothetical protein [Photobacterium nomapromontoriensis]|uniref:hypothetical protein n=1 Tax=Photobacterium nomapromontoriensis TaxID=2910237 RepID=UPI003D10B163
MINTLFTIDNSICSTVDYEKEPEKYRGQIICFECKEKAWFIRSFTRGESERSACFAAHHLENCNASTVIVSNEEDSDNDDNTNNSDFVVDLDRAKQHSILTSEQGNKHNEEDANWINRKPVNEYNQQGRYAVNKSLRQILTYLHKNPHYADDGQTIQIRTDSDRVILDGALRNFLVPFSDITDTHSEQLMIFWGCINNVNTDKDGALWLNHGNSYSEPSIYLDKELKQQLKRNFKLNDFDELQGAYAIVVGNVALSPKGKAIIRFSFTKYISFRKARVLLKGEPQVVLDPV